MAKISKMMTRIVSIGKLKSYELKTQPFTIGNGVLDIGGGQNAQFTIFDNQREGAANPHTKASDFQNMYKEGDLVFITGQDNRSYSDKHEKYFEDIMVWDYREAEESEQMRYVFVYIADVKEINEESVVLNFINYKDEEMPFEVNYNGVELPEDFEEGARVKIKGNLFSGMKMDFFGDGEFMTERNAAAIEVLNTAEEIEEDQKEGNGEDGEMWS